MTVPIKSLKKSTIAKHDIWGNTNLTEEREQLREFWTQLSHEERMSLVKLEKDVIKNSLSDKKRPPCHCDVCGKKSSIIEEDLNELYDTYYKELAKFANSKRRPKDGSVDFDSEEEVSTKMKNTLTMRDGGITVAHNLMKNDGKKFLKMVERVNDQKLKREQEPAQSEEEDEDGNEVIQTEEQKIDQAKKMFQLFAARIFERRILRAYREKVAQERQKQLIKELEEEDRLRQERETKKQREKEKKKETKRLERLKQEQEKLLAEEKQIQLKEEQVKKETEERQLQLKKQEKKMKQEADEKRRQLKIQDKKMKEEKEKQEAEERQLQLRIQERKIKEEKVKQQAEERRLRLKKREERIREEEQKRRETERVREERRMKGKKVQRIPGGSLNSINVSDKTSQKSQKNCSVGLIGGHIMKRQLSATKRQDISSKHLYVNGFSVEDDGFKRIKHSSHENTCTYWTESWTALSDTVHKKLFGGAIIDRSAMVISRAKEAYFALNYMAELTYGVAPGYQMFEHLLGMMNMYPDNVIIDMTELYETLYHAKSNEFECILDQQQCILIRFITPTTEIYPIPNTNTFDGPALRQ